MKAIITVCVGGLLLWWLALDRRSREGLWNFSKNVTVVTLERTGLYRPRPAPPPPPEATPKKQRQRSDDGAGASEPRPR